MSGQVMARRAVQDHVTRRRLKFGRALKWVTMHLILVAIAILFLTPFYWMVVTSLKPLHQIFSFPVRLIPSEITLDNYREVLAPGNHFLQSVFNTTIITASSVVLQSFFASLAGYTFAKCSFRGREALFTFTLATVMIPSAVGMIPNYILMSRIGWIDTWWALIIPGAANTFGIFWMRQYIGTVPDELIDAGRIDGVGEFGLYWRIVVPVIKPALASLAIFIFMGTWNAYLAPLVYLRDMAKWTVQLIVAQLGSGGNIVRFDLLAAGSVLATLPILVFFVALQKQFVAGIMAGAIK